MCIYNVPHCTVNTGVFAIALCVLFYTLDNVDGNTSAWFVSIHRPGYHYRQCDSAVAAVDSILVGGGRGCRTAEICPERGDSNIATCRRFGNCLFIHMDTVIENKKACIELSVE